MADRVYINGIDLSQYVQRIEIKGGSPVPDDYLFGYPVKYVTIAGTWDNGTRVCAGCGVRFTPAESTPSEIVSVNDSPLGWACDACTMAVLNAEK